MGSRLLLPLGRDDAITHGVIFLLDASPISAYRPRTMQSIILTVATIKVTVVGGALGRCA